MSNWQILAFDAQTLAQSWFAQPLQLEVDFSRRYEAHSFAAVAFDLNETAVNQTRHGNDTSTRMLVVAGHYISSKQTRLHIFNYHTQCLHAVTKELPKNMVELALLYLETLYNQYIYIYIYIYILKLFNIHQLLLC